MAQPAMKKAHSGMNIGDDKSHPSERRRKLAVGGWNRVMTVLSGIDLDGENAEKMIEAEIARHTNPFHHSEGKSGGVHIDTAFANLASFSYGRGSSTTFDSVTQNFSWKVAIFVNSRGFSCGINVFIIIGAILMGLEAEPWGSSVQWLWDVSEHFFTAVFAIEMLLMLIVMRGSYFKHFGCVLDFVICWASIFSAWVLPLAFPGLYSTSFSTVRVFRTFRLLRILRIMKSIPELRMVLEGIAASMKAIMWVFLLLFLVIYSFSIFFVHVAGNEDSGYPGFNDDPNSIKETDSIRNFNNFEYFGDMYRSLLTLFGLALLVEYDAMRPVWEHQWFLIPFFFLLIFVSSFAIVNVIIGVICESTNVSMERLAVNKKNRARLEQMKRIHQMTDIMWSVDADKDGEIDVSEMAEAATNHEIMLELRGLGLPKGFSFEDFHTMLNLDGKDGLAMEEFVDGMHRLIFSNDFQKACLMQLGVGQVRSVSYNILDDMHLEFRRLRRRLRRTKATLLTELRRTTKRRKRRTRMEPASESSQGSGNEEDEKDDDTLTSEEGSPRTLTREVTASSQGSEVANGAKTRRFSKQPTETGPLIRGSPARMEPGNEWRPVLRRTDEDVSDAIRAREIGTQTEIKHFQRVVSSISEQAAPSARKVFRDRGGRKATSG